MSFDSANTGNLTTATANLTAELLYDNGINWSQFASLPVTMPGVLVPVWGNHNLTFTALAGQPYDETTLAIRITGAPSTWIGVDNVSLTFTPAPEPSALVLLAMGLFGLLAYAWRKRK